LNTLNHTSPQINQTYQYGTYSNKFLNLCSTVLYAWHDMDIVHGSLFSWVILFVIFVNEIA